jgi:phosphatidylserine/phosphatidylglycerophosphate/cardiolipin synthase-like enzyme
MKIRSFVLLIFLCANTAFSFSEKPTLSKKTVKSPQDLDTCFSPDEPCAEKLLQFINSAEKTLDMAIYSINLDDLVESLIKKSEKIKVRIVCDRVQAHGAKSKVHYLLENGVNIRYGKQKGIMHDKFSIVDNKMIETGSFNYTNHASTSNQENQLYLANQSVVDRYRDRFEQIWETSTEIDLKEILEEMQKSHDTKEH